MAMKKPSEANPPSTSLGGARPSASVTSRANSPGMYSSTSSNTHIITVAEKIARKTAVSRSSPKSRPKTSTKSGVRMVAIQPKA